MKHARQKHRAIVTGTAILLFALASVAPRSVRAQDLAKFEKALPYVFPQTIPKGTYKTMSEEVLLPSIAIVIEVVRDLPDDLVYSLTKMISTHNDEFKTYSRVCKFFTKEAVDRTNFICREYFKAR